MPAPELRIANRAAYFRKAIRTPAFGSESVLTRDVFQFVDLWLARHCKEARPLWRQARNYYLASRALPPESAPLTLYYCFLNAAKALLVVKGEAFSDQHGVAGSWDPTSNRVLSNEIVNIKQSGVLASLSQYLEEPESKSQHNLIDLLGNLPFVHRAYRHTFHSKKELFIPLKNLVYRKHPTDPYVWFSAEVQGRSADARVLRTLPSRYEVDGGYTEKCILRTKKRAKWRARGSTKTAQQEALERLQSSHRINRVRVCYISAATDLWYLKRDVAGAPVVDRYGMTIIMAIMHRLSELSRYDPKGLLKYLGGKENWLLAEFIELAADQFIDELACEMTSREFRTPGVRGDSRVRLY